MLATVLEANASKNIFGLEITVGKEMKSTSTKKKFLRVIVFNKNINSICDLTHSGRQCSIHECMNCVPYTVHGCMKLLWRQWWRHGRTGGDASPHSSPESIFKFVHIRGEIVREGVRFHRGTLIFH